jgi:hypothetical protein
MKTMVIYNDQAYSDWKGLRIAELKRRNGYKTRPRFKHPTKFPFVIVWNYPRTNSYGNCKLDYEIIYLDSFSY